MIGNWITTGRDSLDTTSTQNAQVLASFVHVVASKKQVNSIGETNAQSCPRVGSPNNGPHRVGYYVGQARTGRVDSTVVSKLVQGSVRVSAKAEGWSIDGCLYEVVYGSAEIR